MKIDGKVSNISMFCKALYATWCKTDMSYVYKGVNELSVYISLLFYVAKCKVFRSCMS